MTIVHISDLHFGRISHPSIVDALVNEANEAAVDLVAVSGDLTQRARPREFRAARAMLDAIDPPVLVVAGNHDVYPWWRPIQRLRSPLGRYRHFITDDLSPTYEDGSVSVLGLTSAYGSTIKGGRLGATDRARIRDHFGDPDRGSFKVLVVHHQLTRIRGVTHDVARHARMALETIADAGVHLILCGHLHISNIESVEVLSGERRLVIASAGTATSNRWREPTGAINFYNRVAIEEEAFEVEERRYVPTEDRFVSDGTIRFDRPINSQTA